MRFLRIRDFCETGSGGTPSRSKQAEYYHGGSIPWVKSGELARSVVDSTAELITERALRDSSAKLIAPGGILIAMYGATVGQVSRLAIPAATNQAVCHVYPDTRVCAPDYLYYVLRSAKNRLLDKRVGGGQPNISQKIVRNLQIPLPPLEEQKRIAGILDAADGLRAKRRESLAQLDTLLQSTFHDMFGDPVTNPMGWPVRLLGSLITHGPQNGLYKPARDYGSGIRILRIDGFYNGTVEDLASLKRVRISRHEADTYGLSESEIVVNRVNSRKFLGKCALIPRLTEQVVFESNMMRFSLDENTIVPRFAVEFLQTTYVSNQILRACKDAVNQSSINQRDVKGLQVLVPPVELQRRFTAVARSVNKQKTRLRTHLGELDTLFASLQSRAFRAEL